MSNTPKSKLKYVNILRLIEVSNTNTNLNDMQNSGTFRLVFTNSMIDINSIEYDDYYLVFCSFLLDDSELKETVKDYIPIQEYIWNKLKEKEYLCCQSNDQNNVIKLTDQSSITCVMDEITRNIRMYNIEYWKDGNTTSDENVTSGDDLEYGFVNRPGGLFRLSDNQKKILEGSSVMRYGI